MTATTAPRITAGELFPEIGEATELQDLLARLATPESVAFGSLLEDSAPLCPPDQSDRVRDLTDELLDPSRGPVPAQAFAPFLVHAAAPHLLRLVDAATASGQVSDVTTFLRRSTHDLVEQVSDLTLRALVVMLRTRSRRGLLHGDSPEARYEDFVAFTRTPAFEQELAAAFPLLIPLVRRTLRRSVDHLLRVLTHLAEDRERLHRHLGIRPEDRVSTIAFTGGDRHRRGRAVTHLTFASGAQVVHKPRRLAADAAFQRLVAAVNEWTDGPDLRVCGIVQGTDYGWMEFVETAPVPNAHRIGYFEQIGRLTALLHVLHAHDMHHSNLVCDGRGPVAIDLEGLLRPTPAGERRPDMGQPSARDLLDDGVTTIGTLPLQISNGHHGAIDLGATGYVDGVLSPFRSLVVHNRGRDDLTLALEQVVLSGRQHAPAVEQDSEEAAETADAVVRGFRTVWSALEEHRAPAAALITRHFRDARVRIIHNPTSWYMQLLRMVSGPHFLDDTRTRLLALQRVGLSRSEADPCWARSELADLVEGDVPYFEAVAGAYHVLDGAGERLDAELAEPPLTAALRRLDAMTPERCAQQTHMIRLSFVSKLPRTADLTSTRATLANRAHGTPSVDLDRALRTARQIGDELVSTVNEEPGRPSAWVGPRIGTAMEDEAWTPGVLGATLYAGGLGPALFLAHLARVTGTPRYRDVALSILDPIATTITDGTLIPEAGQERSCGVYGGLAGIPYVLAASATSLGRPDLVSTAVQALGQLQELVAEDVTYDLIGGSGGLVAAGLAVRHRSQDPHERAQALRVALAAALHLQQRYVWGDVTADRVVAKGYTGFGHGAAGLYPYLREVSHQLPEDDITGVEGLGAIARPLALAADRLASYSHSRFDPEVRDWFGDRDRSRISYAWCHGGPGIALGHVLTAERRSGSPAWAGAELAAAADLIHAHGLGNNLTYCHGDLGNVEILHRIASVTRDTSLETSARRLAHHLVSEVIPAHLGQGRSRYRHTNSLLIGTSGVGHFLLRQIDPEGVPSVLTLD